MNYRRICVWTGPLGQTDGLMRTLTSLPGASGLRDPLSQEFIRLTGAVNAAPNASSVMVPTCDLLVMRNSAAHAIGIDLRKFSEDLHLFFLQHPDERLPSLTHAVDDPDWQVRAYTWQEKLYERFEDIGARCLVLDARMWRSYPRRALRKIADCLGVNATDFNPVIPQPHLLWSGEALLRLGPDEDLRERCLKSYHRLFLQGILDFSAPESESSLPLLA